MCQGLETQQHVSSPCCYCLFGGDLTRWSGWDVLKWWHESENNDKAISWLKTIYVLINIPNIVMFVKEQWRRGVVIVAGNPGVPRDNLYPTRTKPVPVYMGTGFCG